MEKGGGGRFATVQFTQLIISAFTERLWQGLAISEMMNSPVLEEALARVDYQRYFLARLEMPIGTKLSVAISMHRGSRIET